LIVILVDSFVLIFRAESIKTYRYLIDISCFLLQYYNTSNMVFFWDHIKQYYFLAKENIMKATFHNRYKPQIERIFTIHCMYTFGWLRSRTSSMFYYYRITFNLCCLYQWIIPMIIFLYNLLIQRLMKACHVTNQNIYPF
jgi:hypothetical protein